MITTRYIGELESRAPLFFTDFLIVGSGIAGLFTALKASEHGRVVVLTKKTLKDSNTGLAQGALRQRCTKRILRFCTWRTRWRLEPDCVMLLP